MKLNAGQVKSALSQVARSIIQWAPKDVRRLARFAYRLPVHYAMDLSRQRALEADVGAAVIFPRESLQIVLPSDRIAHTVYSNFFFERPSVAEWMGFLALAEGCRSLADVGASGGVFSTLFACSRSGSQILSIEPDPPSASVLHDVRALNSGPGVTRWIIDTRAVGDGPKKATFLSSGYGAYVFGGGDKDNVTRAAAAENRREAKSFEVDVERFDTICEQQDFRPDVVKIDIESYEHELISSSLAFLDACKPRIHLELHIKMLKDRGLDPLQSVRLLKGLGYRVFGREWTSNSSDVEGWVPDVEVVRLDLICGPSS